MATIDESIKNELGASREFWFKWLIASTVLVFVGVVLEEAESWMPHVKQLLPLQPLTEYRLTKKLAKFGWILIVVGVMGEGVFEVLVSRADAKLQSFDEASLTEARRQAGDAAASAKTAHEEADAVKGIADEARADAKDALAKAQAAQRELANAEADAAKAQAAASNALTTATDASARAGKAEASLGKAETEARNAESSASNALTIAQEARQNAASFESELERLKKRAADRVLDERQQANVALKIGGFLGSPYELGSVDTSEAENLLLELDGVLSSAGWMYKPSEDKSFRFIGNTPNGKQFEFLHAGHGVEIGLTKTLGARFKSAADKLAKALNSEEILATVVFLPDSNPSPNNIHIMVLGKP